MEDINKKVIQPISFLPVMPVPIYDSNCVEFWREINPYYIPNLNGRYFISTFGRVYDKFALYGEGKFLEGHFDTKGYLQVGLIDQKGKLIARKIHRLEMMTFYYFPGCEEYEVNHKDGNHTNNFSWNLEWCTGSENRKHAILNGLESTIFGKPIALLSDEEVYNIRGLVLQHKYSYNQIIDILNLRDRPGISRKTIERIVNETTSMYRPYWYG